MRKNGERLLIMIKWSPSDCLIQDPLIFWWSDHAQRFRLHCVSFSAKSSVGQHEHACVRAKRTDHLHRQNKMQSIWSFEKLFPAKETKSGDLTLGSVHPSVDFFFFFCTATPASSGWIAEKRSYANYKWPTEEKSTVYSVIRLMRWGHMKSHEILMKQFMSEMVLRRIWGPRASVTAPERGAQWVTMPSLLPLQTFPPPILAHSSMAPGLDADKFPCSKKSLGLPRAAAGTLHPAPRVGSFIVIRCDSLYFSCSLTCVCDRICGQGRWFFPLMRTRLFETPFSISLIAFTSNFFVWLVSHCEEFSVTFLL